MLALASRLQLISRRSLLCSSCPHPSALRSLILHKPSVTTHTLVGIYFSQHLLDSASRQDSAECTCVPEVPSCMLLSTKSSSTCQGHTGCCGPPLLHLGHVASKKPLLITRWGGVCRRKIWFVPCWLFCLLPIQTEASGFAFPSINFLLCTKGERHLPHPPLRLVNTKHHTNVRYY